MYTRCHLCDAALGGNTTLDRMPVGRRLAYDAAHGRLWVVCPRCGEWNLTPIEERWEAIEECERRFSTADARVSAGGVTVATADGVELVRLGEASRDEIANTRYGPRILARRRRRMHASVAAGVAAGAAVGGLVLLGLRTGVPYFALIFGAWGTFTLWSVRNGLSTLGRVRLTGADGKRLAISLHHARGAYVPTSVTGRKRRQKVELTDDLLVPAGAVAHRYYGDDCLAPLAAILPRLNAAGADEAEIRAAVSLVDEAEAVVRRGSVGTIRMTDRHGRTAWQRLLRGEKGASDCLGDRTIAQRLALEMAVTEEVERRAMREQAAALEEGSAYAREVAAIADDMFLPAAVTEWIGRFKGRQGS